MKAKKEKTGKDKIEVYEKVDGGFVKTDEKLVDANSEELYGQKGIPFTPKENQLPEGITELTGIVGYAFNKGVLSWEQIEEFKKSHPEKYLRKCQWMDDIKGICNEQGILPEDMVREWKEMKTIPVKELRKYAKNGKELFNEKEIKAIISGKVNKDFQNEKFSLPKENVEIHSNPGLSKWQLELRKKKLGI